MHVSSLSLGGADSHLFLFYSMLSTAYISDGCRKLERRSYLVK